MPNFDESTISDLSIRDISLGLLIHAAVGNRAGFPLVRQFLIKLSPGDSSGKRQTYIVLN